MGFGGQLLIATVDAELDFQVCLVGYPQAFLMLLGLQNQEEHEVSLLAAENLATVTG